MARLARRLCAARLQDSEFRWVEGDAALRVRCASFPLANVPPERADSAHVIFRDAFMTLARWVPDYFETRAGFHALRIDTPANVDEWIVAAGGAHASPPTSLGAGPSTSLGTSDVERFSFLHIMVFSPPSEDAANAAADGARRLGRLRAGLRIGYRRRRHVSVTYVPDHTSRDTRSWHFGSDSDPYRGVAPAAADGAALARALQTTWLDRLTKEILHG
jgi:hypothetical protein